MTISAEFFWKTYAKSSFGKAGGCTPREYAKAIGYDRPIKDEEDMQGKPMVFTLKEQSLLSYAMYSVWCQIASDIERSAEMPGSGFTVTNDVAVETVLDMDNLKTFGEQEADAVIGAAMDVWGHDKVFDWLCKNIKLR